MADYDLQYQDTHIDALLATANELKTAGYIYKGVATPSTNPGTPTERVAYLASEPGTYTNFGGIVITSGLYSLTYASGTWTATQMQAGSDIEVVQTTGQSTSAVMSQKAVTDKLVGSAIAYDNSQSGFATDNVQGALDETASGVSELMGIFSGVKLVERFTLTGNNRTSAVKRFNNLIAGETYRLTVDLDTFDYSNSALNGYNIFSAGYLVGSQETVYFRTMKGTDTVVAVHEFVAADADYTYVLIRANAGCVVQLKIEEVVDNTEYIDEEPTEGSDKLVRSGGVYNSINNIVNALASTKFSIIGNGNTGVNYRFYPQAGSHCILVVDLSTFIHTNVSNGYNIYGVFYRPRTSSTSEMIFRTMKGTDALVAKHEFDAVDAEYYEITIRANVGQEVDFSLTIVDEDGYIPVDNVPTKDSQNLVRSGGVYDMVGKAELLGKTLTLDSFTCSWATNATGYLKTRYRCAIEVPSIPVYIKVEGVPSGFYVCVQSNLSIADALSAQVSPIEDTPFSTTEYTFTDISARVVAANFKRSDNGNITAEDIATLASSINITLYPWVSTGSSEGTDILSLNKDAKYFLDSAILRDYGWSGSTYVDKTKPAVFLHFSDLHGNARNLDRIVAFKTQYASYFNDIIGSGDLVRDTIQDDFTFWNNAGAGDILQSTGNHEYYANSSSYSMTTSLAVYQAFFGNVGNWGVTQPSDAAANGYCFYYKDYPTYNLRLIVLDSMTNVQAQTDFVSGLLDDIINNHPAYHVIIFCHTAPYGKTLINCPFQTLQNYEGSPSWKTYLDPIATLIDDFLDTLPGHFAGWMYGHTHRDFFCKLADHPRQLAVAVCSATDMSDWPALMRSTDMYREVYTKSMDLFNIVVVDTANSRLKLKRIGADVDRDMIKKGTIVYDYANMQVLYYD